MVRQKHTPLLLPLVAAIAAAPVAAQDIPSERTVVGVTLAARGAVEALDLIDMDSRSLTRRSDVFDADALVTGEGSQAQVRMVDDSVLSLRSNSELIIAEYEFDEDTEEGRAVMELVSGGLRTLTGRLSPEDGDADYELRTAVGSIGIRGTHYEVVQADDELFMAVWDGEIEVNVTAGDQPSTVILGPQNDYAFASVSSDGTVTFYLEPPDIFADGFAEEDDEAQDGIEDEEATDDDSSEEDEDSEEGPDLLEDDEDEETVQLSPDVLVTISSPAADPEGDRITILNLPTPPSVVADRSGTATFNDLMSIDLAGTRTDYDVTLSFDVNFTRGTVDGGQLELVSPSDGDRWLALFEGGIIGNELMIGPVIGENQFNFASHNDQPAEGSMSGQFFGPGADRISGSFDLNQIADPSVNVSGDYTVGEQ
ncbi:MAG: FecR domain-containing protein [Natronospirillum sp.]|uniref:FecR domain-containing protein n=1 Tax=Natronospirillum sp. TaxID=2812955 RepID=UPI0025E916CF|nr:FecR domain-containing protein [Natronospirillum sp.]MCH8552850.1 FecR domain-containing protein [Natronospirillum sp.]